MATTKYRLVDTSTLKGLKAAERLKARGWEIGRSGLFLIWMFKRPRAKS